MSEIKHTPGKWKRDHLTIVDERGMKIAQVEAPHHMLKGRERNEDMEWCKGNARLIAAAPELLEALQEMIAIAEGKHLRPVMGIDAARRAIAKATGSQS